MQLGTTNYFYTRDHLGSIRELSDGSGQLHARYDYDPYGLRTKLSGDIDSDFAFTGHYYHQPSALNLTLYRAYDANLGRWLSRDPIGENGGINLYGYVLNDPVNAIDPSGLLTILYYRSSGGSSANGFPIDFGHIALDVNGHYLDHIPGQFLTPDQRSDWAYYQKAELDLTAEQEQVLEKYIDDLNKENPKYGLNSYCSKDVGTGLNNAGYPVDDLTPVLLWKSATGQPIWNFPAHTR